MNEGRGLWREEIMTLCSSIILGAINIHAAGVAGSETKINPKLTSSKSDNSPELLRHSGQQAEWQLEPAPVVRPLERLAVHLRLEPDVVLRPVHAAHALHLVRPARVHADPQVVPGLVPEVHPEGLLVRAQLGGRTGLRGLDVVREGGVVLHDETDQDGALLGVPGGVDVGGVVGRGGLEVAVAVVRNVVAGTGIIM